MLAVSALLAQCTGGWLDEVVAKLARYTGKV